VAYRSLSGIMLNWVYSGLKNTKRLLPYKGCSMPVSRLLKTAKCLSNFMFVLLVFNFARSLRIGQI